MPAYACAVHEVFECTAVSGCKRVRHQTAGIPPMVTLNVKEKGLFSGLFGGASLLEKGDIFGNEQVLILWGRKGLQTWTAVVEKPTGAMSASISQAGRTFTQFGTCDPTKQNPRRDLAGRYRAGGKGFPGLRFVRSYYCASR